MEITTPPNAVYQADVKIYLCLTAKLSRKFCNFVIRNSNANLEMTK